MTNKEKPKFSSFEAMEKEIEKERLEHPVRVFIRVQYYRVKRFIGGLLPDVRCFVQRGRRGYSDRSHWNLDRYLATIIVGTVKQLKENGHGLPTWKKGKSDKQAKKEWNKILDSIIYTFETAIKVIDMDVLYLSTKDYTKAKKQQLIKHTREMNREYPEFPIKTLTQQEVKRFERGWKSFQDYFFCLWD